MKYTIREGHFYFLQGVKRKKSPHSRAFDKVMYNYAPTEIKGFKSWTIT